MDEQTIETLLRKAPPVRVPAGLLERLEADIELPRRARTVTESSGASVALWLRRWIPALGLTAWILAGLVVLAVQSEMINRLREEQRGSDSTVVEQAAPVASSADSGVDIAAQLEQLRKDAADVKRLTAEAEQLREMLAAVPALRAANEQLRAELRAQAAPAPKPEEDIFAASRSKAIAIQCVNNLKQVGLAARIWANERQKRGEPEVLPADFDAMRREISSDKITRCPSDKTTRYEILSPGADTRSVNSVYARCPIHNIVALVDGSVHQLGTRRVLQQDGQWLIEPQPASGQ